MEQLTSSKKISDLQSDLNLLKIDLVKKRILESVTQVNGVIKAFVSSDGESFILLGETFNPDLDKKAAQLAIDLTKEMNFSVDVNGKYCEISYIVPSSLQQIL